jgi:formylglycine-generating enzyme required for sulfatase activity
MRIGSYAIEGELGRGGFGAVFRGRAADGAEVAVKVLSRPESAEARARFERERRLAGSFGEVDGFVPVLDAGEHGGKPFIVMPLVPGGTLRQRLVRGPLPIDDAVAIGVRLSEALGRAHARGVVHRDLKPENILFSADGRPLIADLGLAKHFRLDVSGASRSVLLSKTGEMRGTWGYMPPEQMRDASTTDARADVFALGAILYECLAGVSPFQGETVLEVVAAVELGTFAPLTSVRPDTPAWLARAVESSLASDPAARPSDGAALAAALGERAEPRSRKRVLMLLTVAAIGSLLGAAIGWRLLGKHRQSELLAHVEWTRGEVPASRFAEALSSLEGIADDPAPPEWVATRRTELRARRDLERELASLQKSDERHAHLEKFLSEHPGTQDLGWARARLSEEQRAMEQRIGWSGQTMPRNLSRGAQKGLYVWSTANVRLDVVYVPGGTYLGGYPGDKDRPLAPREIKGFYIGRTEVTWGEYDGFCVATNRALAPRPTFWSSIRESSRHPVVNVTYADARAYCVWAEARLPTDREWDAAARGPDGRLFPWGPAWLPGRANSCDASCPADALSNGRPVRDRREPNQNDGFPFTAPVGSFPEGASPCGALDMAGNVWEWCSGDPAFHTLPGLHIMRGGSWEVASSTCNVAIYNWAWTGITDSLGFRIALSGPP